MNRHLILASAMICLTGTALSQSTSNPILIKSETSDCTPSPGTCYISVTFQGGSINQHENWYTGFISHSNQGNLTIDIDEQLEAASISDTKASSPIALKKNGSDLNISFQGPLASLIPLTFSSIGFKFQVNQTAHDDLGGFLTQLSQLPATAFPVSAATMGYVTVGKQIADFLFKAQMLQGKATGSFTFTPDNPPSPGVYAVLAAEDTSKWQPFVDGLAQIPGGGLTSKNGTVTGITYYVYEVSYRQHIYKDLNAALSKSKSVPWASLYSTAITSAGSGWTLDNHTTIEGNLRKQLDDAQTLLAADSGLTAEEKFTIGQEASDTTNRAYQKRYAALVAAATPPVPPPAITPASGGTPTQTASTVAAAPVVVVGGHSVPVNPTVLSVGHDATESISQTLSNLNARPDIAVHIQ